MGPADILAESFRLIEQEVGEHPFAAPEWQVVRRMIHASGDLELARSVCFRNDPVTAGLRALRQGAPLVTDGRMTAAGLNRHLLRALHVEVHCFIDDPEVERRARESGQTRSHWAMEKAVADVGRAVYVVGNAPTALLALCASVRRGAARPHLVLALPVGFVAVARSKEEALALDVPVISVPGRKGGSAVAAAAVNALLEMAAGIAFAVPDRGTR
jgi:precorrin-8X/cobalt-precorrin-8 methylmutase